MDKILSCQRPHFDNTSLVYDQNTSNEGSSSIMQKCQEEPKRYAIALKDSSKNEESDKKINNNQQRLALFHESTKVVTPRRTPTIKYQHIFLGNFFSCNHKVVNCRAYARDDHMRNKNGYNVPKNSY